MSENDEESSTADMPPSDPVFAAPVNPAEVGRLGKYRVLERLGKGGMGAVYLGFDPLLQRKVALKVMLPKYAVHGAARERFLREARAAANVKSNHVVTIHEVGEEGGLPFISMEYLQGKPLDLYLRQKGNPTIAQTVRVGRHVAAGLAAAHATGLVHRDIKPGNLWLEAPDGRIKILDFGLARQQQDKSHLTQTGLAIGTPAYMSPEQARGQKVDHRTDLFSLGGVLYRLLTGRLPFPGTNQMEVLTKLAIEDPAPIRDLNPAVPEHLASLVHRLLAKDPAHRPQSAEAVIAALKNLEAPRSGTAFPTPAHTQFVPIPVSAQPESLFAGLDESRTEVETPDGAPLVKAKKSVAGGRVSRLWLVGSLLAITALIATAGLTWRLMKGTPQPTARDEPKPEGKKDPSEKKDPVPKKDPPDPALDPTFFNGKDLTGWVADKDRNYWRVDKEKGELVGAWPAKATRDGVVRLRSERTVKDFELTFQIKRGNDAGPTKPGYTDAAFRFRTLRPAKDDPAAEWIGPLVHLGPGKYGTIATKGPGIGKVPPTPAELDRLAFPNRYTSVAILNVDRRVHVWVSGSLVLTARYPELPLEGHIAWQFGPRIDSITFKDIRLLDPERVAAISLVKYSEVEIATAAGTRRLPADGTLPAEPFTVVSVVRPKPPNVEEFFTDLSRLRGLRHLGEYANGVPWSAATLDRIADLPSAATLEVFGVPSATLTAGFIETVKQFPSLHAVEVYAGQATDKVLGDLVAAVPPTLHSLKLHMTCESKMTEAGVAKLSSLPLTSLRIGAPKGLGAKVGAVIAGMPQLTSLSFEVVVAEDADTALPELARCPKLEWLGFTAIRELSAPLQDRHLVHLEKFTGLRTLDLASTQVTTAGAKKLAAALPKCRIVTHDEVIEPKAK